MPLSLRKKDKKTWLVISKPHEIVAQINLDGYFSISECIIFTDNYEQQRAIKLLCLYYKNNFMLRPSRLLLGMGDLNHIPDPSTTSACYMKFESISEELSTLSDELIENQLQHIVKIQCLDNAPICNCQTGTIK